jgi:hypothetical protein
VQTSLSPRPLVRSCTANTPPDSCQGHAQATMARKTGVRCGRLLETAGGGFACQRWLCMPEGVLRRKAGTSTCHGSSPSPCRLWYKAHRTSCTAGEKLKRFRSFSCGFACTFAYFLCILSQHMGRRATGLSLTRRRSLGTACAFSLTPSAQHRGSRRRRHRQETRRFAARRMIDRMVGKQKSAATGRRPTTGTTLQACSRPRADAPHTSS